MENIISAKNISFSYKLDEKLIPVLKDISLDIPKGQFVAVLGHNGSGKSTLAKHFNGILWPNDGTVIVDGIDTTNEEMAFEIRSNIGMVFQNPDNQIVATIVEEDVAFALENMGVEPKEMRKRVDWALDTVSMTDYKDKAPHQLSGGQKQRVAIAGIIAMMPKCIVLDEPTAMLDPKGRRQVMRTIKRLNEENGITIVLITHYMDEAVACDRVVVVDEGEIIFDDVPREVFKNVDKLKDVGLDVPQVTEMAYTLAKNGYDIDPTVLTEEEFLAEIDRLMGGAVL